LGTEEIKYIQPAIKEAKKKGINVNGPLAADTAFNKETLKLTDAYLSMYHDQGLPVLKALSFGDAVNITLGTPIIRTSVDHGTALELAGTNNVSTKSLVVALKQADQML
jgi:4-hydroxythreonine-4-phosphate dehydrogenase